MNTIFALDVYKAKNEVLNSFMQLFVPHVESNAVISSEFAPQKNELLTQSERFAASLENHRFSLLTEKVTAADTRRDKKWTAAKAVLVAEMESDDAAHKRAAETINRLFDSFGKIRNMGLAEQSGAMSSLCNDLIKNHLAELELTNLLPLIQDLQRANQEFIAAYEERTEARSELKLGETLEAKKALITAYRTLVFLLNARILQKGSAGLDEFIAYANTLIRQYRPMVGQKPTPAPDESLDEGLEDEELDGDLGNGGLEDDDNQTPPTTDPTNPPTNEPSNPGGGSTPTETPTDPTKILLLFNDGAHGNVIVKRMEVEPGYQLTSADLPEGYVYAFKADDQADIDAASPGDTVWVTLAPRG